MWAESVPSAAGSERTGTAARRRGHPSIHSAGRSVRIESMSTISSVGDQASGILSTRSIRVSRGSRCKWSAALWLVLLVSIQAAAQPQVTSVTVANTAGSYLATLDTEHSHAGNRVYAAVAVSGNTAPAITAQYAGQPMTSLGAYQASGSSDGVRKVEIFELANAPAGTHTARVTSSPGERFAVYWLSASGAGQAGSPVTAQAAGNSLSLSAVVPTVDEALTLAVAAWRMSSADRITAGWQDDDGVNGQGSRGGVLHHPDTGQPVQLALSGGGSSNHAVLIAVAIAPEREDPCVSQWCKPITIRWQHPTSYVDGSPLPREQIANTMVLWSADTDDPDVIAASPNNLLVEGAFTEVELGQPAGIRHYVARTLDVTGAISDPSSVATFEAVPGLAAPSELDVWVPPVGGGQLTVRAEDDGVYTVVQSRNRLALVWVGTAPVGTECDGSQGINGRYVVPIEAVTLLPTARPEVVVATCFAD